MKPARALSDAELVTEIERTQIECLPRHERPIPYVPAEKQPSPRQRVFLAHYEREALYGGAAGGGKTDALLHAALMYVDRPTYRALVLRRTFPELWMKDAIADRLDTWLRPHPAVKWDNEGNAWRFPSGATITIGFCEADEDVKRYQGPSFHFIAIDELTQWNAAPYLFLYTRLRRTIDESDIPLRLRAATNPGNRGHAWVKARFVEPGHASRPFVPALVTDNPGMNAAEYIATLEQQDQTTQDQLIRGLWVQDTTGRVYKGFVRTRHMVPALPTGVEWQCVIATDLGSSELKPTSAFVVLFWSEHDPRTFVGRAFAVANLTPTDFAELLGTMLETWPGARIVMDEGALGKGYANELRRRHSLPVVPAQKRDKLGFRRLLNGAFEHGEVLLIEGACDELSDELEALIWDKHGLDAEPGLADHLTDALLYGWRESRAFAATKAPAKSPPPGSPEWYQREADEAERRDRAAWREQQTQTGWIE